MLPPHAQQILHKRENLLLLRRPPTCRKCILRVLTPAARKIVPIVRITATHHPDLVAVVKLRSPPQRQIQPERQLQLRRRFAATSSGRPIGASKSRRIVDSGKTSPADPAVHKANRAAAHPPISPPARAQPERRAVQSTLDSQNTGRHARNRRHRIAARRQRKTTSRSGSG